MSAIAGFWALEGQRDSVGQCRAALSAQSLYGPSDSRVAALAGIAMGRNLYRLLPEDEFDRQPLLDEEVGLLAADLRLDNRDDLIGALGLDRRAAASAADSQLLLLALRKWGEGALQRLIGDYAFAWFDASSERLLLARDPTGQRPLFWCRGPGFVAFASMPKGLHAMDGVEKIPDEATLIEFIGRLPQGSSRSYYRDVRRVDPAHYVELRRSDERQHRHWNPARRELRLPRFEDYVEAYRTELDRAVASRLRGTNGLVASHLSGGWDSSAVTATAARLLRPSGGRVLAFTHVPHPEARASAPANRFADEGPLAAAVAALHDNIDHVPLGNNGESPLARVERYSEWFDRPLYNLCNQVWLSQIRDAARASGSPVLLTGEIGNWSLSSAPNSLLGEFIRRGRWVAWAREAAGMLVQKRARLRGVAANSFGAWLPLFIWRRVRSISSGVDPLLQSAIHPRLRDEVRHEHERRGVNLSRPPADHFRDAVRGVSSMDFGELRKGVLGGWGLDKRDASSDRRLIEFCLSLPLDMLMKGGVRRPLARAALSDRLPPAVLDEARKGHQASDWYIGLRSARAEVAELVERIAADPLARSLLDVEGLRALVEQWPNSEWDQPDVGARYRMALLSALSAGQFILSCSR